MGKKRNSSERPEPGGSKEDGGDRLQPYRRKRSADGTGEPFGARIGRSGASRQFVVQMHDATRLHWDLRLEMNGVLRSWAVPRGPSLDPEVKRLAVETEDHPIDYLDFEGIIPEGNYGAGAMIVWDRGTYVPMEKEGEGYEHGKLLFELRGYKLRGVWTLFRTKGGQQNEWLLMKKPDGGASTAGAPEPSQDSILSGLTIDQLREGLSRAPAVRERLRELGSPETRVDAGSVKVMLAEIRDKPFSREGWLFELKYDGFRLVCARQDAEAKLIYRSGIDATHLYPEVARTMRALPYDHIVLDGEVVVLDPDARPNFQRLQKRAMLARRRDVARAALEHPATYYVFDLLAFDDFDLRPLPLEDRKALLREILPTAGPVRFADHIADRGEALFEQVERLGVEGMVAKNASSKYQGMRSAEWIKVRIIKTDDFVIVGYTLPDGGRSGFGALHLASHLAGRLMYVGRVGTGFTQAQLDELRAELDDIVRNEPPCEGQIPSGDRHRWVDPMMVCEVRFKQLTDDLFLRHPSFLRLREDKAPEDCQLDPALAAEPEDDEQPPAEPDQALPGDRAVVISNPDKVFWPDEGYTKKDLIDFYESISPWLLPYLEDRLVVLTRYPDGIAGKSFFQKNAPPYVPDWVRSETFWSEHNQGEVEYFVCDTVESLLFVINMGSIPLHVWGSRIPTLQYPDWCILDLDPKGAPFVHVVEIAKAIKKLCDEIELDCYVKTSGSTGLHVLIPLGANFTFEQCRTFGHVLARVIVDQLPKIATIERSMRRRQGRVYLDFMQNGHGRLLVSPFSVRPLPGAPVSTPLRWSEVTPKLDIRKFTIENVVGRFRRLKGGDPLVLVLEGTSDLQRALAHLAERLE